ISQLWSCETILAIEESHVARMPKEHASLFVTHCYDCHDSSSEEAGVNLETLSFDLSQDMETAGLWQKVLNAINSGEMPPEDYDPLPDQAKLRFLEDLTARMVEARKILSDSGGRAPLRRLNRREYANTIESLLGIQPDVSSLPNDQTGSGFDTQGGSLFVSSDQIQNYLDSARRSLTLLLDSSNVRPAQTRRFEPEDVYTEKYQARLSLRKEEAQLAEQYLAQSDRPVSDFGMVSSDEAPKRINALKQWSPILEWYLSRPENKTGSTLIMIPQKLGPTRITLPSLAADQPGHYIARIRAGGYPGADLRYQYLEITAVQGQTRTRLGYRKVTAPLSDPQIIEFPIYHQPGKVTKIEFHQRSHQDRADKVLQTTAVKENGFGLKPGIWVDWGEIDGPYPAPTLAAARQRVWPDRRSGDSEAEYAKSALHRFAVHAFRGKQPSETYLHRLHAHYQQKRHEGDSVERALIEPFTIILASPEFLYMVNDGSPDNPKRLSGSELAVRLAYTLWSSPPDDELMQIALQGGLHDPSVLREQTQRLLDDPKSGRFVKDFTHQWLQMDRLGVFQFDGVQFPSFDNAVRDCAEEEVHEMVRHVMQERLPLGQLLDSDHVMVNDLLAEFYGIGGVKGHELRPVAVPAGSPRGGLLGTAAVAAMGSDGLRSSPVERGAWVLRHLLHDPPAPAPPNVPQLSRLEGEAHPARELQKLHQEQPQCAQCHRKIDPIGYGLENFDVTGLWRDMETVTITEKRSKVVHQFDIDPSGTFPGGEKFKDFFDLRKLVADQHEAFARGYTEELIAYAMGRPYGFTDESLADAMLDQARDEGFTPVTLIHALVQSETFRSR
ncbi:MAG: DUF1592 domain-containing protein, partial [Planctomycetota bacterium]